MSEVQFSSSDLALLFVVRLIKGSEAFPTTCRRFTTSVCILARATSAGLQSSLSVASTSADAAKSDSKARILPLRAAWCNGVQKPGSRTLTFAACSSNALITSTTSACAAKCNGESPLILFTAGSAFAFRRIKQTSLNALLEAMSKGAVPASAIFGSAPRPSNSWTSSESPHLTASWSCWCKGSSSCTSICFSNSRMSSRFESRAN
mmetsp:Transcript_1845/g.4076  ORF Transcript_1845/g.4076 Transcript_1845/m.4076 type:complete len:206 (+) Transcript_1845:1021-1638(+)